MVVVLIFMMMVVCVVVYIWGFLWRKRTMDEIEVVMVTGGAHGIGRAVVERFGEDGCKVVVLDVNEEMLNATGMFQEV